MTRRLRSGAKHALTAAALAACLAAVPAAAAEPACGAGPKGEEFHYAWRLRGGIRFLAGLVFPASGLGTLKTAYAPEAQILRSELLITAPEGKQGGYYLYASDIDERGARTLVTSHGYEWKKKSRSETTVFDYVKRLARMSKETPAGLEKRVKKLPEGDPFFRDVLTAIFYLRQSAGTLKAPVVTTIYSDGKEYPVLFRPAGRRSFVISGKETAASAFEIVDAPGGRKWPGGVKVWLTDDARRIPVRIEIQQSIASMQLDLKGGDGCTLMF